MPRRTPMRSTFAGIVLSLPLEARMSFLRVSFAVSFLLLAQGAWAYIDSTTFSHLEVLPNPVLPGTPMRARAVHGPCEPGATSELVAGTQVSVHGDVVTLSVQMEASICFATPAPPHFKSFPIGSFDTGEYTLVMQPISQYSNVTYAPLMTSFTVLGDPAAVPLLSWWQRLALVLALLALGGCVLRSRTA